MTIHQFAVTNEGNTKINLERIVFNNPVGIIHTANLVNFGGNAVFTGNSFTIPMIQLCPEQSIVFSVDYTIVRGTTGTRFGNVVISSMSGKVAVIETTFRINVNVPELLPPPGPAAPISGPSLYVAPLSASWNVVPPRIDVTPISATWNVSPEATLLNEDPMFTNPVNWILEQNPSGITFNSSDFASGQVGPTHIRCSSGENQWIRSALRYPINPANVYKLSAMAYAQSGNDRNMYLFLQFYDANGNYISSSVTGWGGTKSAYTFGGLLPSNNVWVKVGEPFGPGYPSRPIPPNTTQCEIGVWFQYSGNGGVNMVLQAVQNLRLELISVPTPTPAPTPAPPAVGTVLFDTRSATPTSGTTGIANQTNGSWGSFLNQYGVWGSDSVTFDSTYSVNVTTAGTYQIELSADNTGEVFIDGVSKLTHNSYTSSATATVVLTAGSHTVRVYGTNAGGPAAISVAITFLSL